MDNNQSDDSPKVGSSIVGSSKEYFSEILEDAFGQRRLQTTPLAIAYLVELLEFFMTTENLFETREDKVPGTLAESLLVASNASKLEQVDLYKKLGDTTLYISGYFGDSLQRKVIDIDYYADIGGMAYANLASLVENDLSTHVFKEFSSRFMDYVDVLTLVSQKTLVQTNDDLLRLYDRYVSTGSNLAKDQLIEKGLLNAEVDKAKGKKILS